MYAFSGILAALLRRARTGTGARARRLDVRCARRVDGIPGVLHRLRRRAAAAQRRARMRPSRRTVLTPPATGRSSTWGFRTSASGRGSAPRCSEQPALATDPRFSANADRVAHREELDALITAAFATHSAEQVAGSSRRRADRQRAHEHRRGVSRSPATGRARTGGATVDSPAGPIRALRAAVRIG